MPRHVAVRLRSEVVHDADDPACVLVVNAATSLTALALRHAWGPGLAELVPAPYVAIST